MQGVIYIRVSSDEQVKGTSLEFQEELCRQYCAQKGIEVAASFREEGETAKDLSLKNRKKFLEALEFCRQHRRTVNAFVVLRVDRFARNTNDHFSVRKILLDYGVTLHSVTEPIGNSPAEKFIEVVLAGASEYENAIRRQRCTDGMAQKLKQGLWPWKPPIGYCCAHAKKHGKKKLDPDPPDLEVFPLVQMGLKTYARGGISQVELARKLDVWGLQALRGRRTTSQFMDRMLGATLRFYAGIIVNPWTGEETDGRHQPMISKDEMHQILLVRSGRARPAKREKYNPAFPLRRTVACAYCRMLLTGSAPRGNGGRYLYYHCRSRMCPLFARSIPKADLEEAFRLHVERIVPKLSVREAFKATILDYWQERGAVAQQAARSYEREIAALSAKRKRIYEMLEDGSYDQQEFRERKGAIEHELAALRLSREDALIQPFDTKQALDSALSFIGNLGKEWFQLPPQLRPRFQQLVFPEGIPYSRNDGFGTTRLGLIFTLLRDFDGPQSSNVHLAGFSWNQILEELRAWYDARTALADHDQENKHRAAA